MSGKQAREIEAAYKYCERVTRRHAKSFYFAARFLPPHKQRAVFPIYAFCRHVDDEIDEIGSAGDEAKAVETVGKWKRQLENLYAGREKNESVSQSSKLVFAAWRDLLKRTGSRRICRSN
jgi:phytoene/squalene synthetase